MGVSPSTVVEAYDRLAAEGLIRARRGSGFYVAAVGGPPLGLSDPEPRRDRNVDPFWVSRQSLDADAGVPKPGCGWLPAEWMPLEALRRSLRVLVREEDSILADYGGTRGLPGLRRYLCARFAREGLEASLDQVMLTGSGTQAIDLVCRFLLRPGDTVLIDDPCYFNFQALLRAHQARIVGVPYTSSGPDVAAFEAILASDQPRLYITNSALHNPTGATITAQTAHRIVSAAAAHRMTIVEDDIFADFEPEPSARLSVLDGLDRVVRIGSFSKTLSASIRCGYIAARADWVESLVDLQVATCFGGPSPLAAEADHRCPRVGQLPQAYGGSCAGASRGRGSRRRPGSNPSASAPGSCRAAACISGAVCRRAMIPPSSRARPWRRMSFSPRQRVQRLAKRRAVPALQRRAIGRSAHLRGDRAGNGRMMARKATFAPGRCTGRRAGLRGFPGGRPAGCATRPSDASSHAPSHAPSPRPFRRPGVEARTEIAR